MAHAIPTPPLLFRLIRPSLGAPASVLCHPLVIATTAQPQVVVVTTNDITYITYITHIYDISFRTFSIFPTTSIAWQSAVTQGCESVKPECSATRQCRKIADILFLAGFLQKYANFLLLAIHCCVAHSGST